jgi:hypothetical protein
LGHSFACHETALQKMPGYFVEENGVVLWFIRMSNGCDESIKKGRCGKGEPQRPKESKLMKNKSFQTLLPSWISY